jgi:hypothetical protein
VSIYAQAAARFRIQILKPPARAGRAAEARAVDFCTRGGPFPIQILKPPARAAGPPLRSLLGRRRLGRLLGRWAAQDGRLNFSIEVLNVKVTLFIVILFVSLPDCGQNQTAVSDEQYSLSDFYHAQGRPTVLNFHFD